MSKILGGNYFCKECRKFVIKGQVCMHDQSHTPHTTQMRNLDMRPFAIRLREAADNMAKEIIKLDEKEHPKLREAQEEYDFITGRGNHHG